jgi:hypothetical protein
LPLRELIGSEESWVRTDSSSFSHEEMNLFSVKASLSLLLLQEKHSHLHLLEKSSNGEQHFSECNFP